MRLVIDGRLILPHPTGIGRYLLELIPAVAGQSDAYSIEVWLQDRLPANHPAWTLDRDLSTTSAKITIRRLDYAHFSPAGWLRFPLDIRRYPPDLLHYPHFDLPPSLPGKIVITLHDLKYLVRADFFAHQPRLRQKIVRGLASAAVRRACRVICVSQSTAEDARRFLNADPSRLAVTYLGVSPRFFIPVTPDMLDHFRRRYAIDGDYILFVGERRPHKNLPGLIRAFHRFQKYSSRRYRLVIVGRPYLNDCSAEQTAESLSLSDRIRFIDHIPEADLPALYQSASALLFLSYYEGFGLPALEAMASRIPVIASDRGALPEVCGSAARLISPDDPDEAALALRAVLDDPAERDSLVTRGLVHAQSFTWERCAEQTLEIYRNVLA